MLEWPGGWIDLEGRRHLLRNNTFTGNSAGRDADGLWSRGSSTRLVGNLITDNTAAGEGGGVEFHFASG